MLKNFTLEGDAKTELELAWIVGIGYATKAANVIRGELTNCT
jgi:hypothetical protein